MDELSRSERFVIGLSTFAAILGIVTGYVSPSLGTNVLKDFLVFAGGGGIAFALARAGARATSTDKVRSLCSRSVQRLGLAASHARGVSAQLIDRAGSNDGHLLVLASALDNLAEDAEVSIGDLEEMAGTPIRLDPLVAEAKRRIERAVDEALPNDQSEMKSRLMAVIAQPLQRLEAQVKDAAPASRGRSPVADRKSVV